jgi:hypothetical protein
MTDQAIILQPKRTYLAMIKNSVGSNQYRNCYVVVNGEEHDIMKDGDLSCAFFVSSILNQFDLVKRPHATVSGTVKDMLESGWVEATELQPGDVIVWAPGQQAAGEVHAHIGFYMGDDRAISNSYKLRTPTEHPLGMNEQNPRPIEKMLSHPFVREN